MFQRLAHPDNPDSLAARMRRGRMRCLDQLVAEFGEPVRLLDVGGTPAFWRAFGPCLTRRCEVTLLNIDPAIGDDTGECRLVRGDCRDMRMFRNHQFDICFSNSVIEHLGSAEDQARMAAEVRRVGRGHFVQTPNFWFPLEPHFLFPLWQFLPARCRALLHSRLDLGWMPRQHDFDRAIEDVRAIRLLTRRDLARLFPSSRIAAERLGPFVKSWIVQGTSLPTRSPQPACRQ